MAQENNDRTIDEEEEVEFQYRMRVEEPAMLEVVFPDGQTLFVHDKGVSFKLEKKRFERAFQPDHEGDFFQVNMTIDELRMVGIALEEFFAERIEHEGGED